MNSKRTNSSQSGKGSERQNLKQEQKDLVEVNQDIIKPKKYKTLDRVLLKLTNGQLIYQLFVLLTMKDIVNFLSTNSIYNKYFGQLCLASQFCRQNKVSKLPKQIKLDKIKMIMNHIHYRSFFQRYLENGQIPKFPSYLPKLSDESKQVKLLLGSSIGCYNKEVVCQSPIFCSRISLSFFEEKKSIMIWELFPDMSFQIILELKLQVGDVLKQVKITKGKAIIEVVSDDLDNNQNFYFLALDKIIQWKEDRIKSVKDVSELSLLVNHTQEKKIAPTCKRTEFFQKFSTTKLTEKDIYMNCEIPNLTFSYFEIFPHSAIAIFIDTILGIIILVDISSKEVFKSTVLPYISPLFGFCKYESDAKDYLLFASQKDIYKIKLWKEGQKVHSQTDAITLKETIKTTAKLVPIQVQAGQFDSTRFIIFDDAIWILFSFETGILLIKDILSTCKLIIEDIQTYCNNIFLFVHSKKESQESLQVLKIKFENALQAAPLSTICKLDCKKNEVIKENRFILLQGFGFLQTSFTCVNSCVYEFLTKLVLFKSQHNSNENLKEYCHTVHLKNNPLHKNFRSLLDSREGYLFYQIFSETGYAKRFTHIVDFNLKFNIIGYSNRKNIKDISY